LLLVVVVVLVLLDVLVVLVLVLVLLAPQSWLQLEASSPYSQTVFPQVDGQSDSPRSDRTHTSLPASLFAACHQTKPSIPAAWSMIARLSP
jgi:hypothetical protein